MNHKSPCRVGVPPTEISEMPWAGRPRYGSG